MKTLLVALMLLIPFITSAQIGSIKTDTYKARFEKGISLDSVLNYKDTIKIPIQLLKIGISEELYEMYPDLKDKRVGLGVTNIVIEFLEELLVYLLILKLQNLIITYFQIWIRQSTTNFIFMMIYNQ